MFTDVEYFLSDHAGQSDWGFRVYSQFVGFLSNLLQTIVADANLGTVEAWDHILDLKLDTSPLIDFQDFLNDSPAQAILQRSRISTPSKYVETPRSFLKCPVGRIIDFRPHCRVS